MDLHTQNNDVARIIKTARLLLRPLGPSDLNDVVRLAGDYEVSKMLVPVPHPYTLSDAQDFLAMDQAGELDVLWMITHDTALIGAISIGKELGYWLGRPFWGQGYMTEAAIAALRAYFRARDVDVIDSSHFVENRGSRRVLEKLGFHDVGPHSHFSNARQASVPGRSMRLTRAVWQNRHA